MPAIINNTGLLAARIRLVGLPTASTRFLRFDCVGAVDHAKDFNRFGGVTRVCIFGRLTAHIEI